MTNITGPKKTTETVQKEPEWPVLLEQAEII